MLSLDSCFPTFELGAGLKMSCLAHMPIDGMVGAIGGAVRRLVTETYLIRMLYKNPEPTPRIKSMFCGLLQTLDVYVVLLRLAFS